MRLVLAVWLTTVVVVVAAASARGTSNGVPRGFEPDAAAAVGTGRIWVLGDHVLLRSTDGGKHFARVGALPLQSQGTVPTLDFANPRDGFAYVWHGGPLYVTHDGGSSWHRAGPKGHVVAFALGGGDAYVVVGRALARRSDETPGTA
jgi:photosystem II stability/assembly factor-like uncharacterized protein